MNENRYIQQVKSFFSQIDWKLLLFLTLILNVKITIKLVAILLIYLLQSDFRFAFKLKHSRLPLFYLAMPAIALLNWILNSGYANINTTIAFGLGITLWAVCLLSIHQLKLFTEKRDSISVHNTIYLFFVLNILISFLNYINISVETGVLNIFQFRGMSEKYYVSAGDYIRGVSFDDSMTNAVLSAIGVLYFLMRNQAVMTCLNMSVLLLTGSNATLILTAIVLIYQLIFQSTRNQKRVLAICFLLILVFQLKISFENSTYIKGFVNRFYKEESLPEEEEDKQLPGKIQAYIQTFDYFKENPEKIISGAGMGNFSSRLAFRTTGLNIDGTYPSRFQYINDNFKNNHLALHLFYFTKETKFHSVTNRPNSTYDQIISEYGLLGTFSFLFLYVGYFFPLVRKRISDSFPLILLMGAVLLLNYWFEQLSIIIIAELVLLLRMKDLDTSMLKEKYEKDHDNRINACL